MGMRPDSPQIYEDFIRQVSVRSTIAYRPAGAHPLTISPERDYPSNSIRGDGSL
jgi:hypothetical protein